MIIWKKRLSLCIALAITGTATPLTTMAAGMLEFDPVTVPDNDTEKRQVRASESVLVNGVEHEIGFNTLMRSGQGFDLEAQAKGAEKGKGSSDQLPFGTLIDNKGDVILDEDGQPRLSNDNDFNSLIPVGDQLFMVSHFESRPGAMYLTGLDQNKDTGELTAQWTRPIDFSGVRGGWVHCAGSVTPWNTHLGSEEYEPDARLVDPATGIKKEPDGTTKDDYYHAMDDYVQGDPTKLNPYDYGYAVEVAVLNAAGDTSVTKHYAMGRSALELAYVMPDNKTVYLTDDGRFTGLFMFVADQAGKLSAGTLYAAKWNQTDGSGAGMADLSWINLGHATNAQIASYLTGSGKLEFADIFDAMIPGNAGSCDSGYSIVVKGHDKTAGNTYAECLKLKPGMELAASRLETRRYAALMGATTEFNKEEGVTFDPDKNRLYIAMSDVTDGMLNEDKDEKFDGVLVGPDHIGVNENRCGVVYGADVAGGQKDTGNNTIASSYVAKNMYGVVEGMEGGTDGCVDNGIANPDNVSYLPGYDTLIIGEDTSKHQNDMVWSFNTTTTELTRIETTPYGSETTSVYWYPNINGFGYLMSVVQHPFGESDKTAYQEGSSADRGYSGYIGPFPALD